MKPIVINNFQKGMAPSSFLGFEEIRGLNTIDKPGVAFPNFSLTKESSTTIDGEIINAVFDNQGQLWACSSSKLFKRATNGTWSSITLPGGGSSGTHYGVQFWGATTSGGGNKPKGFIQLFAGTKIDQLDLADETTWDKGWTDLGGASATRRSFVASDRKVYISLGANYNIASIAENSFDQYDGAAGNATITTTALQCPFNFIATAFEEIGSTLLICGTISGTDNHAMILPWDKASADFETPIKFYEDGDYAGFQIISIGLKAYVHVGKTGKWYITDGTVAEEFAQIPVTLTDLVPASTILNSDAIALVNGKIFFGLSTDSTQRAMGIYSLDPKTAAIKLEHLISTGGDGTDNVAEINSIKSLGNKKFLSMWTEGGTPSYGADKVNTTRYTSDEAYIVSKFYRLGTPNNKKTLNRIEVELSKPMASGDSVKIYYRTAQNGSWLSVNNDAVEDASGDTESFMSHTNQGAVQSWSLEWTKECENIQFKIVLNDEAELFEVRIT